MLSEVANCSFKPICDDRGSLLSLAAGQDIPFDIKRIYYLYDTTRGAQRGFHAHKQLRQVAVCIAGSCCIEVESVAGKESFKLTDPQQGLYMGGMVWREIKDFSPNSVLLVIADEVYLESDYIRNYEEFQNSLSVIKYTKGVG